MTLPIWIHLLLRQRAKPMDIGSIRFVKDVVRRTKSRQRIQRWLLLALRALAVLLLGLLFARPFLPDTPADGRTREVAVLIDRSASMSAEHEDGTTAMDTATRRAQQYVDSLGDQARVHIGLFDSSGVESICCRSCRMPSLPRPERVSTKLSPGRLMYSLHQHERIAVCWCSAICSGVVSSKPAWRLSHPISQFVSRIPLPPSLRIWRLKVRCQHRSNFGLVFWSRFRFDSTTAARVSSHQRSPYGPTERPWRPVPGDPIGIIGGRTATVD